MLFKPYPLDAERLVINLEMAYDQWLDARRTLAEAPTTHIDQRQELLARVGSANSLIEVRARLYRALKMPSVSDRIACQLRQLDIEGLLGPRLLVTGPLSSIVYNVMAGGEIGVPVPETFGDGAGLVGRDNPEAQVLFLDRPITLVVATTRRRACPLAVPAPLVMASFLAQKPGCEQVVQALHAVFSKFREYS